MSTGCHKCSLVVLVCFTGQLQKCESWIDFDRFGPALLILFQRLDPVWIIRGNRCCDLADLKPAIQAKSQMQLPDQKRKKVQRLLMHRMRQQTPMWSGGRATEQPAPAMNILQVLAWIQLMQE